MPPGSLAPSSGQGGALRPMSGRLVRLARGINFVAASIQGYLGDHSQDVGRPLSAVAGLDEAADCL